MHVVRLPNGELQVLSGVSPHRGQTVLWFPDAVSEVSPSRGLFGDSLSWGLVDGTQFFGPAPRDLPRYRFEIDGDGVLVIDLSEAVEVEWLPGRGRGAAVAAYDVLDPDWPTSGWPSDASR